MFLLLFLASLFSDVKWLDGFPFYEAVILYNLLFQKSHLFFCVCVFPSLRFEKLNHCPILFMLDWFHA